MKSTKVLSILVLSFALMVCQAKISEAVPMGTAFTYQGHLYDANRPANGQYDFQFKLFEDPCDANQVGSDINKPDTEVTDAYFTVELDFGNGVFDGNAVWLEIAMRPGEMNDPNVYTTLSPRQKVTPTPYANYAKKAGESGLSAGVMPVGGVIAWLKSLSNTPSLPSNFVECNGQTLSDANSPYDGQTIPNLNGSGATKRFLRGSTTSGATGGSESHIHGSRTVEGWPGHEMTSAYNQGANHLPPYYEVVWIMRVK